MALSDAFDYLYHRSTAIVNCSTLSVWDRLYTSESDVYRRQIMAYKVYKDGPSSKRVNLILTSDYLMSVQVIWGGGPRVVVSTAAFHASVRGSVPGIGGLKETKNVSSPSTCESQYCGEPP